MRYQLDLFRPDNAKSRNRSKGAVGEKIGKEFLVGSGRIRALYEPIDINQAHPFDLIVELITGGQILGEIKTYASRALYRDTGINIEHKAVYLKKQAEYQKKLFIIFIDDREGKIYGQYLDELLVPYATDSRRTERGRTSITYPFIQKCHTGTKIYFSLDSMRLLADLSEDNISILRQLSTSTYTNSHGTESRI